MTTPPSSVRTSPRKILSESSDARSLTSSLTSSKFAQLLSKFEVLDAVSSVGNLHHTPSKIEPVSGINVTSTIEQHSSSASKRTSQGSARTRERDSTGSSHISSSRFIPSNQEPPRPRQSKPFGAQAPIISSSNADSKSRQKSVAERRMIFETASQQPQDSIPPRTSIPRSPSKLAHSKSWQSIKTRRSAAEREADNCAIPQKPTSDTHKSTPETFSPTTRVVPSPRTLLASDDPFGTWRSPLNRPGNSWTSFKRNSLVMSAPDASPSYMKSQYTEMTPQSVQTVSTTQVKLDPVPDDDFVKKHSVSVEETRHHGWVRNARKIASSLSNTVSVGSSSLLNRSRGSYDASSHVPSSNSGLESFKFTGERAPSRSKLPHSRISNLRRKFDRPKEQSPVVAPLKTKHPEPLRIKTGELNSPSGRPLLRYSDSSESERLNAPRPRAKSYAPRQSHATMNSPRTPVGRRNTEKQISPLKQKIDLFESLDRQAPFLDSPRSVDEKKQSFFKPKRKDSVVGPLRTFKGTLRRISTSCRRIPSEWSTTSSRDIGNSQLRSDDDVTVVQDDQGAAIAAGEPLSPHTIDAMPEQPVLRQTFLTNEIISPLVLEKPLSLPRTSITQTGFNIDGEAGLDVAPPPLFTEAQRRFSHTRNALSRTANRFSLPDIEKELELIQDLEYNRQTLPEHDPFVSKAGCELEQPRPVRANELKRLVTLCKDKVRKISAGRSE